MAAALPSERSMKPRKALEWGVPRVHLDWLLDSVCALEALPIEPYLLQPEAEREDQDDGKSMKQQRCQQQQHAEAAAPRAVAAVPLKRPSSVASNLAPAPAATRQPLLPQQQQQQQQQGALQAARPALEPLAQNALAAELSDRLRSMSISPEPSKHMAAGGGWWHSSGSEEEQAEEAGSPQRQAQQQVQQQQEPWRQHAGAQLQQQQQQHTPASAGSSQRSLSLLGMVQRRLSGSQCGSPVAINQGGCMPRPPAGTPAPGASPMSVAAGSPSEGEQPQTETSRRPFAFSPAAALASPLSPMAESPAAALAMADSSGGVGRGAEPMSMQQRQSSLSRRRSWRSPLAPFVSPAPLRVLSDSSDGMEQGENPAGASPCSTDGLTQTPQVIKDALLLTAPSPLQAPAYVAPTPLLEQAAAEAAGSDVGHPPPASADAGDARMCTPAAVRDWTDDDDVTVAPDQPSPCDIVPDSEDEEGQEEVEELESPKSSRGQQQQQAQQAAMFCMGLQVCRPSPAECNCADASLAGSAEEPLAESPVAAALLAASPLDGDGSLCDEGDEPSRPSSSAGLASEQRQPGQQPQQQQSQRPSQRVADWSEDDSGDEVPSPAGAQPYTGLTQLDPALVRVARPRAVSPPPPADSTAGGADACGVAALRLLQRPPRGNAVKERHGLRRLSDVQFAESVRLPTGLALSTKDKKTAVLLPAAALVGEEGGHEGCAAAATSSAASDAQLLAEPAAFYRLTGGAWQLECYRFFNAEQAEALATARGVRLALPPGFDRRAELLRAAERSAAVLADVAGTVPIKKVKVAPGAGVLQLRGGGRGGARPAERFWRWALDTRSLRVLTDTPAAAFILD